MNESKIKEAAKLISQREKFNKALDGNMLKKLEPSVDWYSGSGNWVMQKHMVAATKECREVCETILRNRAEACIADINRQLAALGVSGESGQVP